MKFLNDRESIGELGELVFFSLQHYFLVLLLDNLEGDCQQNGILDILIGMVRWWFSYKINQIQIFWDFAPFLKWVFPLE
ncbi:unnamed protein product [Paramecium octaurelia]|uniref:Uncharacterized protein n=1 Tax=Paramecium octaurelia TaxID=43137 RepID=A0A8S1YC45_PAROT|nr:unnamed protein product [Paramecium octaurelia]